MVEETIELPLDVIKASMGFSLDIGGSMAKLIYRSKEDFTDGELNNKDQVASGRGIVRQKLVSRENMDQVIAFIKENCDMTRNTSGECRIYCTGVGGNEFGTKIEQELNVKLTNLMEFDCFAAAMNVLLTTQRDEELFQPVSEAGIRIGQKKKKMMEIFKDAVADGGKGRLCDKADYGDEPPRGKEGSHFPFIMAMVGSGCGWFMVEEDGAFVMFGGANVVGRFFLGLISFLTDIRDFDEISRLIEESTGETVDIFTDDVLDPNSSGSDLYSQMSTMERMRVFPMGKGLTDERDKATKGDLIHSVLETLCENLAQVLREAAAMVKIPRVYFAGNFVNTPKAQQFITATMMQFEDLGPFPVEYKFLKNGGMLGALGAFMHTFNSKKDEVKGKE